MIMECRNSLRKTKIFNLKFKMTRLLIILMFKIKLTWRILSKLIIIRLIQTHNNSKGKAKIKLLNKKGASTVQMLISISFNFSFLQKIWHKIILKILLKVFNKTYKNSQYNNKQPYNKIMVKMWCKLMVKILVNSK